MGKFKKPSDEKKDLPLIEKSTGEVYGKIEKELGCCKFLVRCDDGDKIGHLCGRIKKKVKIHPPDLVLCSVRNLGTKGVALDIIHKYSSKDISQLRKNGDLILIEKADENDIIFEDVNIQAKNREVEDSFDFSDI